MISESAVASEVVTIQAPAEWVWSILVDFERFSEWNRFCPQIKSTLELGAAVEMMTDLGFGLQPQIEYITCIEAPKKIAWSMENKPGDPIHACRSQYITALSHNSCSYYTVDDFSGEQMPAMLEQFAVGIERGFNRCASDLKDYAEKRYQQSCAQ
jgi:uncharacterized protein YndB with AHSA1/START domain